MRTIGVLHVCVPWLAAVVIAILLAVLGCGVPYNPPPEPGCRPVDTDCTTATTCVPNGTDKAGEPIQLCRLPAVYAPVECPLDPRIAVLCVE